MAASLKKRKDAQPHDVAILKTGAKAIASAVADSDDTPDDIRIRRVAPTAFKVAYPRAEPWADEDLLALLRKMHDLIQMVAAQRPVHVYDIDEVMQFCCAMYETLALEVNGQ